MLVSDLVNQYNSTLGSGSKIATKTKGVEQLSKTVASLEKGQVFEGTVSRVNGDKVTLSLSGGQTIMARLDKNIPLTEGQSVFFQVKSNEGGSVQIRPVSSEFGGNPTLLNALKGAGLPENETNLKLINAMMKEQMPVDKDSVRSMLNQVRANPDANIETLVSLKKLNLPINESMITQYENYKSSEGEILKAMSSLADDIPTALSAENVSKEDVLSFSNNLLTTIAPDGEEAVSFIRGAISQNADAAVNVTDNIVKADSNQATNTAETVINAQNQNSTEIEQSTVTNRTDIELPKDSIGSYLSAKDSMALSTTLNSLPNIRDYAPNLFTPDGNIRPDIKGSDLIKTLNDYFSANPNITKDTVISILDSAPIKNVMSRLMGDKWTLEPKDLLQKDSVNKLYEEIEKDMQKVIEHAKAATHSEHNPISSTASGIKDNLSFIREVNQIYQYVQIPLKLSRENTTGELYVYANKKQKRAENDEITAFLHFDMEHLGSTDIAVKLAGTKVDTKFFLEDEISFNLIEQNLHILEDRLNELGYTCKLTAENDGREVNFVEDFLKQDVKTAGDIRRYSFDVRA